MNKSQNIYLTIVTESQTSEMKAKKLSELLQTELGDNWEIITIAKYHKFESAYKIELKTIIVGNHQERINHYAISLADKLASPWLIYFDKDDNSIELIFNKNKNSRFGKSDFDMIKWGHFQITK